MYNEYCKQAKKLAENNGEMAERSKAAVLKTVDVKASWGSNPYLSAKRKSYETAVRICFVFLFMGLLWNCYQI